MTTRRNPVARERPSIWAAASSFCGSRSVRPFMFHMYKGRAEDVYAIASPTSDVRRLRLIGSTNGGASVVPGGIISTLTSPGMPFRRPGYRLGEK